MSYLRAVPLEAALSPLDKLRVPLDKLGELSASLLLKLP